METKTAVLGLILVAICVIPIYLIVRASRKAERNLLKAIKKIANQKSCKINHYDVCGKVIIGFDDIKNSIFFLKNSDENSAGNSSSKVVELSDYKSCKVVKSKKGVKSNNGNNSDIDKLELVFEPVSNNKEAVSLEFYNLNDSHQLTIEPEIIEKWSKIINNRLKK